MAVPASPMLWATAPEPSVACSSSRAISSVESFACGPSSRDGIVEAHDLAHTLDGLRCRIVQALDASAEHRRLRERCDFHAGKPDIDAVNRRSIDFQRRIQPFRRRTYEFELLRLLQFDIFGQRHLRRSPRKLAIF